MTVRADATFVKASMRSSRLHHLALVTDRDDRTLRLMRPLSDFLDTEAAGGVVVVVAIAAAPVWANAFPVRYEEPWTPVFTVGCAHHQLALTLREWVNDGLMAVFFFAVGLELERELVEGELRDQREAAVPAIATVGGMIVPAIV